MTQHSVTISPLLALTLGVAALCLIGWALAHFASNQIITKAQGAANRSSMAFTDRLLWSLAIGLAVLIVYQTTVKPH
jgi:hypothetical protein